ncbi:hypothetical protein F7725_015617 [Dissostichus mawsoni]|uniref:Uncharacterized protein n=1 Tax=Dissostichus mawsoni TaxID=36200 RepID=A0A7J5YIA2_DISMA|nr:hypothetical protein F7725_015617 [Dissostichus mawsoni]
MHLVVKPPHKAMLTVLPHFVERAALTRREICRMNHSRASFKVRAHVDSHGVVFESAQVSEHNQEESAEHVVGTHGCKSHYVRTLLTLMSPQSCPLKH